MTAVAVWRLIQRANALAVLRGFMDTVDFPVLMSNADVTRDKLLADVLQKSAVVEKGGEKIGLIGLTPENTDELASPGGNITFSDPVAAVQAEVDRLSEMGVNKIIVLSHSGFGVDKRFAAETTGVDVSSVGIATPISLMSQIGPRGHTQPWLARRRLSPPLPMASFWAN